MSNFSSYSTKSALVFVVLYFCVCLVEYLARSSDYKAFVVRLPWRNYVSYHIFWRKVFDSDNLLLIVLARSCKESVVAVACKISAFDLLHLDSFYFKNVFWD